MGGAIRFFFLLTPSLHRLCHCIPRSLSSVHNHRRRHLSLSSLTPPSRPGPIKCSCQQHTQPSVAFPSSPPPRVSHSWPEFHGLLDNISAVGYVTRLNVDDEYVEDANLPDVLLLSASACLSFARDRPNLLGMVSRRGVEVIVENGASILFKNGDDSVRRMKSFLGNDVLNSVKANTVDLMRFLLTYASDLTASLETNNLYNKRFVICPKSVG